MLKVKKSDVAYTVLKYFNGLKQRKMETTFGEMDDYKHFIGS